MKRNLRVAFLIAALVALAIVPWLFPRQARKAQQPGDGDRIVVISPHQDVIRNEFKRGFADWYHRRRGRSVDLEFIDVGGTSDCVRYVQSEFKRSPGGIGLDLFFGGGTEPYLKMKKEGALAAVAIDSAVLSRIPQSFAGVDIYDRDSTWYGAVLSGFGIVYNKVVAARMGFAEPREWRDLADPRYFSWVGAGDPRNSGTMHVMFEIILQAYGWEDGWRTLSGISANTKTFTKAANDVGRMVARGDVAYGLSIDFYGWAEVSEAGEDRVGMLLPRNLTVISADGIAMLKGAPHAAAAREFMAYVLSEEGQKIWFLRKGLPGGPVESEMNRMSVRPDFYERFAGQTNVRQNPFTSAGDFHMDQAKASRRWSILNDLIGVALIDHGAELKKAWRRSGARGGASDPLWLKMPVTEAECMALVEGEWGDAVKKNQRLLEWHRFFADKYARLAR